METKEIQQRLRSSLEVTCARNDLIMYLVGIPLCAALVMFTKGRNHPEHWPAVSLLAAIMLLPFAVFDLLRIIRIFRKPEAYIFCRAKLTQPHPGSLRHTMYYTVLLEDEDGRKFPADTHAIFYTHSIVGPTIEDYTNKTVTIAYNRETEMVVVIG